MNSSAFQFAVGSWHDFYLAIGSASAALLGLLFTDMVLSSPRPRDLAKKG